MIECFTIELNTLDTLVKVANVIVGATTLLLGFYVFVYQRKKEKKDRKIQWLKDLIIEPRIELITNFFDEVSSIKNQIKSNDLNEEEKIEVLNEVKKSASNFRKDFLMLIQPLTPNLFDEIQNSIDTLTDNITNAIGNDELKLCNDKTFNREIGDKIQKSYRFILQTIFEYDGE